MVNVSLAKSCWRRYLAGNRAGQVSDGIFRLGAPLLDNSEPSLRALYFPESNSWWTAECSRRGQRVAKLGREVPQNRFLREKFCHGGIARTSADRERSCRISRLFGPDGGAPPA